MSSDRTLHISVPEDGTLDEMAVWKAAARLRAGAEEPLDAVIVRFHTEADALLHREWIEKIGVRVVVQPDRPATPEPRPSPQPPLPPPVSTQVAEQHAGAPDTPTSMRAFEVPATFDATSTGAQDQKANQLALIAAVLVVIGCCGCSPAGVVAMVVAFHALRSGATGGFRTLAVGVLGLGSLTVLILVSMMLVG